MTTDGQRLTILEMEYQIVAARLDVIDAQLGKINGRLGAIETTLTGHTRALEALLRHFKIDD